jgi:hypothetical protein
MKILTIIISLIFNACAIDLQTYNIKKNGQLKKIKIQQINNHYVTLQHYTFNNNSKISVKFKTITPKFINEFEAKYNLQLDEILIIGDYIYTQNSNNILTLIETISLENNIIQIIPLWKKSLQVK